MNCKAIAAGSKQGGEMVYVILADGEFDAIWETEEQAKQEARDLRQMGYSVRVKRFPTWSAAEAYEDRLRA